MVLCLGKALRVQKGSPGLLEAAKLWENANKLFLKKIMFLYYFKDTNSFIRETLNLLVCADSSTYTEQKYKIVVLHLS